MGVWDDLRKAKAQAEIAHQCNSLTKALINTQRRDLLIADLERINNARIADKQEGFYPIPELVHAIVETSLGTISKQPRSKPRK